VSITNTLTKLLPLSINRQKHQKISYNILTTWNVNYRKFLIKIIIIIVIVVVVIVTIIIRLISFSPKDVKKKGKTIFARKSSESVAK